MRYGLLFILAASLWAGQAEIGLRASLPLVPLRGTLEVGPCSPPGPGPNCGQFESMGRRGLWGASIVLPLRGKLGLRLEPGYQRVSFDYLATDAASTGFYRESTTANRWELPLLLEWRWMKHLRVGAGGVWSRVSGEQSSSVLTVRPPFGDYVNRFKDRKLNVRQIFGATAAVELPYRTRFGTLAPELRYTRWASMHFGNHWPLDQVTIGLAWRW